MNKKQLIVVWAVALLFSGCAAMQDKAIKNNSDSMHVSGDVTVSNVGRKGF